MDLDFPNGLDEPQNIICCTLDSAEQASRVLKALDEYGFEVAPKSLRAEIERLRTALEEIASDPTGVSMAQAEIAKQALQQ